MKDLTSKRLQRGLEYALLTSVQLFFVISFRGFYSWWMAATLALITFGMNFQLTQLRERRRTLPPRDRQRVIADTFETILLLVFVVALSFGGILKGMLGMGDQEFLGYTASLLGSLFLAGLLGEIYWQLRHVPELDEEHRRNYIENLHRTIIFPYFSARR